MKREIFARTQYDDFTGCNCSVFYYFVWFCFVLIAMKKFGIVTRCL